MNAGNASNKSEYWLTYLGCRRRLLVISEKCVRAASTCATAAAAAAAAANNDDYDYVNAAGAEHQEWMQRCRYAQYHLRYIIMLLCCSDPQVDPQYLTLLCNHIAN